MRLDAEMNDKSKRGFPNSPRKCSVAFRLSRVDYSSLERLSVLSTKLLNPELSLKFSLSRNPS